MNGAGMLALLAAAGTVAEVIRRPFLAIAVVAAVAAGACSTTDDPSETTAPQITTTTIDLAEVDVESLDPSAGVPVTTTGEVTGAVEVPVESVRPLGDGNYAVSAFVPGCAQVASVTVDGDGDATVLAVDPGCSEERQLVTVTVEAR